MSIETRLRSTGNQGAGGGGASSGSGTVNIGSAGFLAYYPGNSDAVSPSRISTSTGAGVASLNFQALTTQIAAPNTGDLWVLNSAGLYLQYFLNGTAFYTRLTQTDGSASSNSGGLMGTGGLFVTWSSDTLASNEKILTAGNNITLTTSATAITIAASTGSGSSGSNSLQLVPQQAKLYPSNSAAMIDAGTAWWRLLFSSTTQQYGVWQFICPLDYGSNPHLSLSWAGGSTVAVVLSSTWVAQQWSIGHNQAVNPYLYTDTFAAANNVTIGLSAGYTSGVIQNLTIPLANITSLAAGNLTQIRISVTGNFVGNNVLAGLYFGYTRA